jgi:hypothetical protein
MTMRMSFRPRLGYPCLIWEVDTNTVTIVAVGIWNAILLAGLGAVIHWRTRVLQWITQLDDQHRDVGERIGHDRWTAFLAEHPELTDR